MGEVDKRIEGDGEDEIMAQHLRTDVSLGGPADERIDDV